MAVQKHIHKLKKHTYKKTGMQVFFCTLDCNFKLEVPFALGKETLCNICGNQFTMSEYTLKLKLPHCPNCGRREVKDSDGKKRYVKKVSNQILAGVADTELENLRDRLSQATTPAEPDVEI